MQFNLLTDAQHTFWNRAALIASAYLIWDAYTDLKRNRRNRRAMVRMGIGIATLIIDFYVLKSYGANILP